MSDAAHEAGGAGPSHRSVEAGVAVVVGILGAITVFGSLKVGIGWADEGPRAGFFPFYIGLAIIISSIVNLYNVLAVKDDGTVFATWEQIYKVLTVVVPTAIYVTLIPFIGIYVASALLIGLFMIWLGKYKPQVALPTALGVPIFFYITFERWFLVPLPKGPLERMLGLAVGG